MTKTFKLTELDCANCAAKMEAAIGKIDGVSEARISFMTQRLTVTAADDCFDSIMKEAQKVIKSIEKDCAIVL